MNTVSNEKNIQQQYYSDTASDYNSMHIDDEEHMFALNFLTSMLGIYNINSILDIGSGTGRALSHLKEQRPELRIVGIEPVEKLRGIGHTTGLSTDELINGDATQLNFKDGEFDLVCEFGVLHHIKSPEIAVAEMLRVFKKGIFVSDSNNFGQGSLASRSMKQFFNFFGLWKVIDLIKTKGKGYNFTEGDGLSYSYSVFSNYKQIKNKCKTIHLVNTRDGAENPYRTASHVALLAIKNSL